MRRVVFLDIDGVLNNRHTRPALRTSLVDWLDPDNVRVWNQFGDTSPNPIEVVLSSSWRTGRTLTELREILSAGGLRYLPAGATPELPHSDNHRGREISAWLQHCDFIPYRYVVMDDDAGIEGHDHHFVRISPISGLTTDDVAHALRILA